MSSRSGSNGFCSGGIAAELSSSSSPSTSGESNYTLMFKLLARKLRRLCSRVGWPARRQKMTAVAVHGPRASTSGSWNGSLNGNCNATIAGESSCRTIRIATFNVAMFSMAPAVNNAARPPAAAPTVEMDVRCKTANDRPKGILKHKSLSKSKRRVSINLPDNEISRERSKLQQNPDGTAQKGKAPAPHSLGLPADAFGSARRDAEVLTRSDRSVLEVLREVGADVIGLQNVKAEEEKGMRPLSELAEGLGMKYVFAESWAPQYGNAILSKWPIKRWKVHRICDDTDFRNVLKATIEVPRAGELNFHCTHLDHLDESWRMKQINSILRSSDGPHILAGGLNSLDETDYSAERWEDIVKYYEEIGKPTPRVEVIKYLKSKQYVDAKDFAGECESVVVVAKGQDVQGTCKYGTRIDYILASPNSHYKFVPGTYGVLSSQRTSDHHIVKVDIDITNTDENDSRHPQPKQRIVKIDNSSSGILGAKL